MFYYQQLISYFCTVRQKTNIFVLFLVGLFFISTTGITIYKHHCSHGGEFYGVFVDVAHDCEPEDAKEVEKHACCSGAISKSLEVNEDCCTSDVQMYQIDTDLALNDFEINFLTPVTFSTLSSVAFSIPELAINTFPNKAPPLLTTSERLALFQIYLI